MGYGKGVVYFIRPAGQQGPVKIGCTSNLGQRFRSLNRRRLPLEIAAVIPGNSFMERQFHTLFREFHLAKEWFFAGEPLLTAIEHINAGRFDVAALPESPVRLPRKPVEYTAERRKRMSVAARRNAERRRVWAESVKALPAPEKAA